MIIKRVIVLCVLSAFLLQMIPALASVPAAVPQPEQESAATPEYRLSKYDVLNIVILGFSDVNMGFNDIIIGPDGFVNLPYAGSVKLGGLTIAEATQLLTERLGQYIKIPGLSVMIKQYGPRKVYVVGEVSKQGIYDLSSDYMNVFAAISSAGGITKRGRPKHIAVVRTVNGKVEMQEVDFDRFVKKQDASQNVALLDGDMVYVPRSNRIILQEDVMPFLLMYGTFKSITD
jgi:polysaccharide export outer membrane protein